MKRQKLSLMITVLIVIFIQGSTTTFNFLFLKDIENTHFNQRLNLRASEITPSIILLPNDSFDEEAAAQMVNRIDSLPISLLEKIYDQHIKIRLFTGHLTDFPSTRSLTGITPRGYADTTVTWDNVPGAGGGRIVFVKIGASDKGEGHGSVNLELHELAHSIDRIVFKGIRNQIYFQSIWKLEAQQLFGNNDYYLLYPEEYFAEVFAYFYADSDTNHYLKERAPKTYTFIKKLQ
ncbi:toxin [Caldifermentibacillus hisashii]|uniref:anthrax toxin lethal factor-related metalloendopeptidase n=1 Tax=Caldifermentibacillus hisashii TaxID=996558 RepID=UPI0034D69AC0